MTRSRLVTAGNQPSRPQKANVWPDDALERAAEKIGATAYVLLLQPRRWIHRRVETIEFLDMSRLRRRMSVDFTLPKRRFLPQTIQGQSVSVIPIALLTKRVLKNFDLRDETGGSLPILTRQQNVWVARSMITLLAETTLQGDQLDAHVRHELEDIVGSDMDAARRAYENLFRA